MSIATEISRIQSNKTTIRAKLVELGMATNTDNLDRLAAAIESLVNRGAVSVTVTEGKTYTIPAGYHNGSGTVKAVSDTEGDANTYKTQAKTVTPTKKQQSVTPDAGYYALESVTVSPIPDAYQDVSSVNATASEVLAGKIFVAANGAVIAGEMPNNGAVAKTIDTNTTSYTIPAGYHNGSGKVSVTTETKSATPTKTAQNITPSSGKVLSKVTVDPIPDAYQDVSAVTATASHVLEGNNFVDADGNVVAGTMADRSGGANIRLFVGKNSYTIPEGYHAGTQTVGLHSSTVFVTPTKQQQRIEGSLTDGDSGFVDAIEFMDTVFVEPIPTEYQDITVVTAEAEDVLSGKVIVGSNGKTATGKMPNNGSLTGFIDGMTTTSFSIPAGYTAGGTVSLTNDIENALKAI